MTATETVHPARHAPHAAMVAARPTPTQVVGLLGEVAAARQRLAAELPTSNLAEAADRGVQAVAGDITHAYHHGQPAELRRGLIHLAALAITWADTLDPHSPPAADDGGSGEVGDDTTWKPAYCDASGWSVRTACVDHHGRAHCPLCGRRVPAGASGPRVAVLDLHEAGRGMTTTVHPPRINVDARIALAWAILDPAPSPAGDRARRLVADALRRRPEARWVIYSTTGPAVTADTAPEAAQALAGRHDAVVVDLGTGGPR